jgi:hypothetical protein
LSGCRGHGRTGAARLGPILLRPVQEVPSRFRFLVPPPLRRPRYSFRFPYTPADTACTSPYTTRRVINGLGSHGNYTALAGSARSAPTLLGPSRPGPRPDAATPSHRKGGPAAVEPDHNALPQHVPVSQVPYGSTSGGPDATNSHRWHPVSRLQNAPARLTPQLQLCPGQYSSMSYLRRMLHVGSAGFSKLDSASRVPFRFNNFNFVLPCSLGTILFKRRCWL